MQNIILIGFMGTGKTAVGESLAKSLHTELADTDTLIVEKAGMSIEEIFRRHGEPFFRNLETEMLRVLTTVENKIISTGGGIVLKPENHALLKRIGKTILLRATPEVIIHRLSGDTTRPLLKGTNVEKRQRIEALLTERDSRYQEAAEFTVETSLLTPEAVAQKIMEWVT